MSAIWCAIASCLPTGRPHCTRSLAQVRQISRQSLAVPTEPLGIDSRPSFKVVRAIFSPRPSSPIRFSAGTRTFLKLITALASARRPMKWQRCSTLTPGQPVSTTKALIFFVFGSTRHHHQQLGDGAVGAPELLAVEDVVSRRAFFSAVVCTRAGSEPTCGSVSAKAEMSPAAQRGRYFFFRASEPNSLSGCGTPIDWWADSSAERLPSIEPSSCIDPLVLDVAEPQAAVLLRDLHAEGAELAQAVHHLLGILARGVDLHRIHLVAQELLDGVVEGGELRPLLRRQRIRVDQVETEIAEEHLPQEARLLPLGLAGSLRHLPRFELADLHILRHDLSPLLDLSSRAPDAGSPLCRTATMIAGPRAPTPDFMPLQRCR